MSLTIENEIGAWVSLNINDATARASKTSSTGMSRLFCNFEVAMREVGRNITQMSAIITRNKITLQDIDINYFDVYQDIGDEMPFFERADELQRTAVVVRRKDKVVTRIDPVAFVEYCERVEEMGYSKYSSMRRRIQGLFKFQLDDDLAFATDASTLVGMPFIIKDRFSL